MPQTIETSAVPVDQLEVFERLVQNEISPDEIGPELRDVLLSVSRCIREGVDLAVIKSDTTFTPNQVAERLGMSRTHLYKMLDSGEIPSYRVGRDRRIRLDDLVVFESKRDHDRRELAERFAKQHQTRATAINEIADLL